MVVDAKNETNHVVVTHKPSTSLLVVVGTLILVMGMILECGQAFSPVPVQGGGGRAAATTTNVRGNRDIVLFLSTPPPGGREEDSAPDPDGANLAAQLFQMAQAKGVSLNANDFMVDDDEEDDEDDEEDDEEEMNFPQGAINAFLGYDTGDVGERLAGNVSLTNNQLYSEVKERVLDTAGGFVDFVKGASDDDDDDDEDLEMMDGPKVYIPPMTVPDSDLTAGEVVLLVLEALQNNDNPTKNAGVKILFGYSSSGSQVKNEIGLTPDEYADFLKEAEYNVLFTHQEVVREGFVQK